MVTRSEDAFKLLFHAAPDAILVVDSTGRVRLNNTEAERLLDAAPGELRGISVERLVPAATRRHHAKLREGFQSEARRRPMGVGLALKAVKLSGHEFPVEISLAPTHSEDGDEVIVILRDVSERLNARRTERELVRANALARVSQLALRERDFDEVIVIMRDVSERLNARRTERELVRANALARVSQLALRERDFDTVGKHAVECALLPLAADMVAIFGQEASDEALRCDAAVGPLAHRVTSARIEKTQSMLSGAVLESGVPLLVGDTATSSVAICPLLLEAGIRSLVIAPVGDRERISGLLIAGSATTHHFTTDDVAFLEAVANIASNAMQRSVAEEKLLLSQRLESLGQLTGGVAHDFNNLLTVISGNLQILEETHLPDPFAQRAIASAHRASKRGAELTAKLLAFARRQTLRPSAVPIPELLASFRDLLARTLGPNIEIQVETEASLPAALADGGQLETALLNLAVNSRDAMAGGGKLLIEASAVDLTADEVRSIDDWRAGRYICISVTDTGTGMTRETMRRAFEPFFTTKGIGKGSGLGLSMVYGFAKQSHGHVTAYSEVGTGTTINLFLPVASDSSRKATEHSEAVSAPTGSECVLVVEDDADVMDVAVSFLKALGYTVFTANNRRSAIARVRANPDIDLLFTDVVLAGDETGPKVAKTLQKIKPMLRVLYASGYARSALP
ncbi:MAG: ATP-binding protein, partial [Casimicrobium sp.]